MKPACFVLCCMNRLPKIWANTYVSGSDGSKLAGVQFEVLFIYKYFVFLIVEVRFRLADLMDNCLFIFVCLCVCVYTFMDVMFALAINLIPVTFVLSC